MISLYEKSVKPFFKFCFSGLISECMYLKILIFSNAEQISFSIIFSSPFAKSNISNPGKNSQKVVYIYKMVDKIMRIGMIFANLCSLFISCRAANSELQTVGGQRDGKMV